MRYELYVDGILRAQFIYKDEAVGEAIRQYRKHHSNIFVFDAETRIQVCCFR